MYLSLNQFNSIDGEKKKRQHTDDVIDGPVAFLCSVLLGPMLFEIVRNRRQICSEETPASLREVNRSFGDKPMILISLVF